MRLSSLKKRLGDILLDVGIITSQQLKDALDIQKRNGGKLGTILAQIGAINEEMMLAFLGKQCGVSYVSLSEFGDIPRDIITSLPESLVRRQLLVPIAREENTITIAMADPFNIFAIDDIKLMTGQDVKIVIASESEIRGAIEKYYFHKAELEEVLRSLSSLAESMRTNIHAPEEELLQEFAGKAMAASVSAIHLEPLDNAVRIRYRVNGILQEQSHVAKELTRIIIQQLKLLAGIDAMNTTHPRAGSIRVSVNGREVTVRVSVCATAFGEQMTLQFIDAKTLHFSLNGLGFEPESLTLFQRCIETPGKLVLITGPIQSGKTATLYSSLASLNYSDRHIVTIERRIETAIPGLAQTQAGTGADDAAASLLAFHLAHQPDVVMLDEITDARTAREAFDAALSGHLILAALPAVSMNEALMRLVAMGITPLHLLAALSLVVHQQLVRKICQECKEGYEVAAADLKGFKAFHQETISDNKKVTFWRGKGCPACNYTGYDGRTAVFELLRIEDDQRGNVSRYGSSASISDALLSHRFLTLEEAAWRKVKAGITTVEEMLRLAGHLHESV